LQRAAGPYDGPWHIISRQMGKVQRHLIYIKTDPGRYI
jgi:hypothetical protein